MVTSRLALAAALTVAALTTMGSKSSRLIPDPGTELVDRYNTARGNWFRDHVNARDAMSEHFRELTLENYGGDIRAFYTETLGHLLEYRKKRSFFKKKIGDAVVYSSSAEIVSVLNHFVSTEVAKALDALAQGRSGTGDPLTDRLVGKWLEAEQANDRELAEATYRLQAALQGLGATTDSYAASFEAANHGYLPHAVFLAASAPVLYWLGPAYLMNAAGVLAPKIYTLFFGAIPSTSQGAYWAIYVPFVKNFEGQVYTHSTVILTGFGIAGSKVAAGGYHLGKVGVEQMINLINRTTHWVMRRGEIDQNTDSSGNVESIKALNEEIQTQLMNDELPAYFIQILEQEDSEEWVTL